MDLFSSESLSATDFPIETLVACELPPPIALMRSIAAVEEPVFLSVSELISPEMLTPVPMSTPVPVLEFVFVLMFGDELPVGEGGGGEI